MLSVRTTVNSILSNKLRKDEGATYSDNKNDSNYLNMTSTSNNTPAIFPTLNVNSIGEIQTGNDLERKTQNFIISTIELKSYSDKSLTTARDLMDEAGDVMVSMGYELIYGPKDISDTNYVMVARFRRLVGSGDAL